MYVGGGEGVDGDLGEVGVLGEVELRVDAVESGLAGALNQAQLGEETEAEQPCAIRSASTSRAVKTAPFWVSHSRMWPETIDIRRRQRLPNYPRDSAHHRRQT